MIHVQLRGLKGLRKRGKIVRRIEHAVASGLDRFKHTIREVRLSVVDVNGPRGGLDKMCRVMLRMKPAGMLVATAHGTSPEHAATEALRRLNENIARTLSRRRKRFRRATMNIVHET